MRPTLLFGALGALVASPLAAQTDDDAFRGGTIEIEGRWDGATTWLRGSGFTGGGFDGGALLAADVPFGSTLAPSAVPPIRIDFDDALATTTRVYRGDDGYADQGTGVFNGAAYDVSDPDHPRRLNVVASEDARYTAPDNVWGPTTGTRGGREYLLVMASDYDGSGGAYAGANPFQGEQDAYYFVALQLIDGHTLFEAPGSLRATPIAISGLKAAATANGQASLSWTYEAPPEAELLRLYIGTDSPATQPYMDLPPDTQQTTFSTEEWGAYYFRLEALNAEGEALAWSEEVYQQLFLSSGTQLLGQLDPTNSGSFGDIWGYTDPATGREYALLCDRYVGLHVIDITDEAPVLVATVPGFSVGGDVADAKDVKVWNQYAYLVHEYAPLMVIDLSDPTDPQVVGEIDSQPDATNGGSHNAEVDGDYLYVIGGRRPDGLRIYDLAADPTDPPRTGGYPAFYFHDIHVKGDLAYASAIYDEGVYVLDISDPSNPTLRTQFIYPAASMGAHNACSPENGDYLYVSDEIGSGKWMRAFDVRDLDDVTLTAELIIDERATVHNCYVEGDFLFVAHYTEGLQVFDIGENPAQPERIAFYDTFTQSGFGTRGAWSSYPYFASGKVIVSDMQSGLFVIGVDGFTPVGAEPGPAEPAAPALALHAFPNPTAGRATLRYALAEAGRFRLALFDVLGREVAALAGGEGVPGEATAALDARGLGLAPGLYLARLETAAGAVATRITVAR